ncbi:MAG: VOC family protein [Rhodospirillaceae bacterium]|nr:VOC family protein [Rhodospirillales bacterium]
MGTDLCHVFVFVEDRAAALAALDSCGLTESFRRAHPGQGTANIAACFDNAYLEVLWPEDPAELVSTPVARTRLSERSRWRETGACPFGIGLRGRLPFPCWDYRPPFLPDGMSMSVALASDDPRQPFLFRSPGDARPDAWPDGMAGNRQLAAGLAEITGLHLDLPVGASPAVRALADKNFLSLTPAVRARMILTITKADGGQRKLSLPDFIWLD